MFDYGPYPPVNVYITMEIHHAINGKINCTWQFSIAMLNYQRVYSMGIHSRAFVDRRITVCC